jgi:dTDP-glucose 4,6-dehydratase
MRKKVLIITGASGFIGMNVLEKLNDGHGFNYIISIDKMGYATKYNAKKYYELCDSVKSIYNIDCDINDVVGMNNVLNLDKWTFLDDWNEVDLFILDFASESHVDNSIADPFSIYTQNASIPANLLAWIGKDSWTSIKAYYHISTDEVYGELPLEEAENIDNWFTKNTPMSPNNPYAASKAAQDCFLMSLRHTFKLPVKFIRMANQFGKYQHIEKMLPASIMRALKGETIKIYGSGKNIRQWTPVEVTANIIVDILDGKIQFDDCIHIANRNGMFDNNAIIDKLDFILNKRHKISPEMEYIEDRKGHDLVYALKTEEVVDNYFDKIRLTDCIESTVKFYVDNKEDYLK